MHFPQPDTLTEGVPMLSRSPSDLTTQPPQGCLCSHPCPYVAGRQLPCVMACRMCASAFGVLCAAVQCCNLCAATGLFEPHNTFRALFLFTGDLPADHRPPTLLAADVKVGNQSLYSLGEPRHRSRCEVGCWG